LRVRANLNTDTPLPPDEPAGENPPDGAMIDYFLSKDSSGPVTIEIKDGKGALVRKYSSADKSVEADPKRLRIPSYWIRPPQSVSTSRGMHRFLWDMHYTPIARVEPEFPISATYRNTSPRATSPWVAPGDYTVTLTIDGKMFSQPLAVAMDPRVKVSAADLQEQFDLSWRLYQLRLTLAPIGKKFDDLTAALAAGAAEPDVAKRTADYVTANNLVRTHVPMVPLVHGASATAWKKDVAGAHSSPIGSEYFFVMAPGDRTQLVWSQGSEPSGLYCGDESDGDALRICSQVFDSLYNYKVGGLDPEPALATSCETSTDAKKWTCKLRDGVQFQKGGTLDANDVVDSMAAQWDVKNPLHVGNLGANWYFPTLFGGCLNPNFDKDGSQTCAVATPGS